MGSACNNSGLGGGAWVRTLLAIICAVGMSRAEDIFVADFNEEQTGLVPTNLVKSSSMEEEDVKVVDAASEPADVFGGAENRSLMVEKTKAEVVPLVSFNVAGGSDLQKGRWEFRIASEAGLANPRALIAVAQGEDKGLTLQFIGHRFSALGSDNVIQFDQRVEVGKPNDVAIDFDFVAGTFTGTLNGQTLTAGGQSTFPVNNKLGTIDRITMWVSTKGGDNFRFFVDDLKITRREN